MKLSELNSGGKAMVLPHYLNSSCKYDSSGNAAFYLYKKEIMVLLNKMRSKFVLEAGRK